MTTALLIEKLDALLGRLSPHDADVVRQAMARLDELEDELRDLTKELAEAEGDPEE